MDKPTRDVLEFFESTHNLYVRPLHFTVLMGMLLTEWSVRDSGKRKRLKHIRFDGCLFLSTNWGEKGDLGPFDIQFTTSVEGNAIEICDEIQQFRVICNGLEEQPIESSKEYYASLRQLWI